jgi:hypothetical protein
MRGYRHRPQYSFDRRGPYSAEGIQDLFWRVAEGPEGAAAEAARRLQGEKRTWKVELALTVRAKEEWWSRAPGQDPTTEDGHERGLEDPRERKGQARSLAETAVWKRTPAAAAALLREFHAARDQRGGALRAAAEAAAEDQETRVWTEFLRDFKPTAAMKSELLEEWADKERARKVLEVLQSEAGVFEVPDELGAKARGLEVELVIATTPTGEKPDPRLQADEAIRSWVAKRRKARGLSTEGWE